jgi:glycosyltransferase involved in cell wall biosynthesis
LERIAIVSEDISRPVDEGFKKATVNLTIGLGELVRNTIVFTRDPQAAALKAERLPANRLLWDSAFSDALTQFDPEVVVYVPQSAATPMSMVRARLLKRQSGGRPVALISLQRRTYSGSMKTLLKSLRPDLVLVFSSQAQAEVRGLGIKVRRISLGVDSQVFRPPAAGTKQELRSKYNLPEGKIVLHVGHLSPGRNLRLLKTIAGEDIRVVVISSTATRRHPEVEAMLQEPWVILMETYIEHIEEIYRAVDGYVFPTFSPTDAIDIPLSVLEAMATNLPVATTDFGGLKDLFDPGEGLFVCSGEDELVQAVRDMLELGAVATRDKVLHLSWQHAAGTVIEAIAEELR